MICKEVRSTVNCTLGVYICINTGALSDSVARYTSTLT